MWRVGTNTEMGNVGVVAMNLLVKENKMKSVSPELTSYTCTNCGDNVWFSDNKPVFGIGGCFAVQGHDYEFDDPTFEGEDNE